MDDASGRGGKGATGVAANIEPQPRYRPDPALVDACLDGDEVAWAELVDRYGRLVVSIPRRLGLSADDADDVFQDVFARVCERLDQLRDDGAFRPWIAQLTRRLCLDRLRAHGREAPGDELALSEPADLLAELELALDVRDALARLPEHCGEILDRFFARDESYRMIGDELGLPAGTIASRISRCLVRLREQLEGRKLAPSRSR